MVAPRVAFLAAFPTLGFDDILPSAFQLRDLFQKALLMVPHAAWRGNVEMALHRWATSSSCSLHDTQLAPKWSGNTLDNSINAQRFRIHI